MRVQRLNEGMYSAPPAVPKEGFQDMNAQKNGLWKYVYIRVCLTDNVVVFEVALPETAHGRCYCGHRTHEPVAKAGESVHGRDFFQDCVAGVLVHRQQWSEILRVDDLRQRNEQGSPQCCD